MLQRSIWTRGLKLCLLAIGLTVSYGASAEIGEPEKDELTFGFIKLTDMAPIAVAYELGYFEDEGLFVTIEAQANWKVLLDGVMTDSWMELTCWQASRWPPPLATAPRPISSRRFRWT